jgi:hypothetical protein
VTWKIILYIQPSCPISTRIASTRSRIASYVTSEQRNALLRIATQRRCELRQAKKAVRCPRTRSESSSINLPNATARSLVSPNEPLLFHRHVEDFAFTDDKDLGKQTALLGAKINAILTVYFPQYFPLYKDMVSVDVHDSESLDTYMIKSNAVLEMLSEYAARKFQ